VSLLARARGLQERIRPIRLVTSEEVGNVRAAEGHGSPLGPPWIAPASKATF